MLQAPRAHYLNKAMTLYERGRFENAITSLNKAIELDSNNASACARAV